MTAKDLLTTGRPGWPWGSPEPTSSLSKDLHCVVSHSARLQACWRFELRSSSLLRTVLQGQALLEEPSSQWGVRQVLPRVEDWSALVSSSRLLASVQRVLGQVGVHIPQMTTLWSWNAYKAT